MAATQSSTRSLTMRWSNRCAWASSRSAIASRRATSSGASDPRARKRSRNASVPGGNRKTRIAEEKIVPHYPGDPRAQAEALLAPEGLVGDDLGGDIVSLDLDDEGF